MKKTIARYGFLFYIITMILSFIFPKVMFGNIYVLSIYLVVCLTFIYLIYFYKTKKVNNDME